MWIDIATFSAEDGKEFNVSIYDSTIKTESRLHL